MDFTQTSLPLLSAGDFDYNAFFQEQDIDYLAEESSASTNTLPDVGAQAISPSQALVLAPAPAPRADGSSTSGIGTGTSPGTSPGSGPAMKQRLERRGHTKSRRGCFNCKRRRIKVRANYSLQKRNTAMAEKS